MDELSNRKQLKELRKRLRNNLTPAEATLWRMLRRKQLEGRKFRRQHSIGNYILDFYCPFEKLAIELDGQGHFTEGGYTSDKERDEYLLSLGIKVIRFENENVFNSIEGVLEVIKNNFRTK